MCELFAMVSRHPTKVTFTFDAFAARGGREGPHCDGWGVAAYEGYDLRILREPCPAARSAMVAFLHEHPLEARIVLSHIRLATMGARSLAETQPVVRELGGRKHVFAHNGHVPGVFEDARFALGCHRPVGTTDSEHAACALFARLRPLWAGAEAPSKEQRHEVVAGFARELAEHGPANFLYSDGELLFAHGHRRTHCDGPDGTKEIRPPGLHVLTRRCPVGGDHPPAFTGGGVALALGSEPVATEQRVVLLASVPLTDEAWRPLEEGELLVIDAP
ncbi:MAG: class II glutamine amidotransferase [Polyangiaceae bacterium]